MTQRYDFDGRAGHLLRGYVTHERLRPVRHAFRYPLFQVLCDLGRLDTLSRWWFGIGRRRIMTVDPRDFGPRDGRPLETWMRERLAAEGIPADGRIWLQSIPRLAGYAFNPVSFWYCHDREGHLRALYADVRSTFGEHHGYLLSAPDRGPIEGDDVLLVRKMFHVSPFFDVIGHYAFRVQRREQRLVVRIDYSDDDGLLLRTAISMCAEPLNGWSAARALLAQPFGAVNVMIQIHWQAARLWLMRVPFYGRTPPNYAVPPSPATPFSSDASASRSHSHSHHHDHEARR